MSRFLVALSAREGQEKVLCARIVEELQFLRSASGGPPALARGMLRLPDDPFAAQYPTLRPFDAVIECETPSRPAAFEAWLEGLAGRLEDLIHADLSGIVSGETRLISGSVGGPVRFLYFMRRKEGWTHESFSRYWGEEHVKFGMKMPGILGYEQLHAAPDSSSAAAGRAGFGVLAIDGVAILHLKSVDIFLAESSTSSVGAQAIEDERNFVDGRNSVGMSMNVVGGSD